MRRSMRAFQGNLTRPSAKKLSRKLARITPGHQVFLGTVSAILLLAPYIAGLYGRPLIPSFHNSSAPLAENPASSADSTGPNTQFSFFNPVFESAEETVKNPGGWQPMCDDSEIFDKGMGAYRCLAIVTADEVPVVLDPCFGLQSKEVLCAVTATRMWRLQDVILPNGGTVKSYSPSAGQPIPWRLLLDNGETCLADWLSSSTTVKDGPLWICVLPKSLAAARRIANPDSITFRLPLYGSPLRVIQSTDDPLNYTGAAEVPAKGTENDYVESVDFGDGTHWTVRLKLGDDPAKMETHRVIKATF